MKLKFFIVFFALATLFFSCGDAPVPTPKPRGYPRVEYPTKEFIAFDKDYCQFTFEYPKYADIEQDKDFFDEKPVNPCWFDLYFKDFDGRLHCSYYPIDEANGVDLEKLKRDAFNMASWHNKRANYIDEIIIQKENKVAGILFKMEGAAASPIQFYLTDSTQHFLRAALYFNTKTRPDSMAPIHDFIEKDVLHIIETFEWNEQGE